jgi:hypothetical protein
VQRRLRHRSGIDAFCGIWVSSVQAAIAMGSGRLALFWLVGDRTDWDPAIAVLGIVIGLPALLLSAQAGAKDAYTDGVRVLLDEIAVRLAPQDPQSAYGKALALYTLAVGTL